MVIAFLTSVSTVADTAAKTAGPRQALGTPPSSLSVYMWALSNTQTMRCRVPFTLMMSRYIQTLWGVTVAFHTRATTKPARRVGSSKAEPTRALPFPLRWKPTFVCRCIMRYYVFENGNLRMLRDTTPPTCTIPAGAVYISETPTTLNRPWLDGAALSTRTANWRQWRQCNKPDDARAGTVDTASAASRLASSGPY